MTLNMTFKHDLDSWFSISMYQYAGIQITISIEKELFMRN